MSKRATAITLAAVLAITVGVTTTAAAATITVTTTADELTTNGTCSLREAIAAANRNIALYGCPAGSSGFDTIMIPAGMYRLTRAGADEDSDITGDLDVRSPLALVGAGAASTVIDAAGLGDRVLHVMPQQTSDILVELHGLTLRNGGSAIDGGGLLLEEFQPDFSDDYYNPTTTIEDCIIEGNTAAAGGGIRVSHPDGGTVTIRRTQIRGNTSTSYGGGGMDSFGTVYLLDSTVADNTARGSGVSSAGGIFDNLALIIRNSTISSNHSAGGPGGIGMANDELSIANSTISGNVTGGTAGGIAVGDTYNVGTLGMVFTTVTGNTAARGGGIVFGHAPSGNASANVTASIIAGNTATTSTDVEGQFYSGGDNVVGDGTGSSGFTAATDHVGTAAMPLDARLAPLADNGGPTATHALRPGSPAIDRAACIGVDKDQRSLPRPVDTKCDVGAFESGAFAPCAAGPMTGCTAMTKGSIAIKADPEDPGRGKLTWKVSGGAVATTAADFGDPVAGDNGYRLCAFDSSRGAPQLALEMHVSGGGSCGAKPCWTPVGVRGFKYKDGSASADGVAQMIVQGGTTGRTKLAVKAKGANLPLPAAAKPGQYFSADPTVTVQVLESSTGNCWESVFVPDATSKNLETVFKVKLR